MKRRRGPEYVPALGYRWLTRFYDPLRSAFTEAAKLEELLLRQLRPRPGQSILDLGCGSGAVAIRLKRACPQARVVGLDADPEILRIARRKAAAAGLELGLCAAAAFDPPFPDACFDRVVSSLVFHHLTGAQKRATLAAVRRLLRPGGELHVLDWGRAENLLMRLAFLPVQLLDGFETTGDNVRGMLVPMMEEAGFSPVEETHREGTFLGTLALYRAVRPAAP